MTRIGVIELPQPEEVQLTSTGELSATCRESLTFISSVLIPPAKGGTYARIRQFADSLEEVLEGPEPTVELPSVADPSWENAELSDRYFGILRSGSADDPVAVLARATLRSLHTVLNDILQQGSTLTAIEAGNLFKLPIVMATLGADLPPIQKEPCK